MKRKKTLAEKFEVAKQEQDEAVLERQKKIRDAKKKENDRKRKAKEFKKEHGYEPPPEHPEILPYRFDPKPGTWESRVDLDKVKKLASLGCTHAEIASFFDVPEAILHGIPEYKECFNIGKGQGKVSLRRSQWEAATKGNVSMLIWLGKQILGQKENPEEEKTKQSIVINVTSEKSGKK